MPGAEPTVARARELGIPVWSEVELAARMLENPIIGITGTNGKTTTTELVGAMLREAGIGVEVAGNVGRALCELPGRVDPDAWIACELSSFQLEDIDQFHARVAVVLNITPDHLDRHGSMAEYARCKLRLLENQTSADLAVLNGSDPTLRGAQLPGHAERAWFTAADAAAAGFGESSLSGDHNRENAAAAAIAAARAGASSEAIAEALRTFTPPAHRMELVAEGGGVQFVNDSKATNPDAVIKALTAYAGGVHLILGGSLKGGSFDPLAVAVAGGPVVHSYLIGAAAASIGEALGRTAAPFTMCETLEGAVPAAAAAARPGDVVLLSPACASFDQFRDYEDRGARFAEIAREVAGGH